MSPAFVRVALLITAIVVCHSRIGRFQETGASWLDEPRPASWNKWGLPIPATPQFASTLSPQVMDSRTDGALARAFLESDSRLMAEYHRYTAADPLCCPSKTTRIVFEITKEEPVVEAVSASTSNVSQTAGSGAAATTPSSGLAATAWQLVKFQGSDDTTLTPDDRAKYTIQFTASGGLTARVDCNRGGGTWKSSGANQIAFGPLALTRAQCPRQRFLVRGVKKRFLSHTQIKAAQEQAGSSPGFSSAIPAPV